MMTASDILAAVPPSVQLTLLGIGALFLAKKTLDFLPLVSSLVLGGTNVSSPVPPFSQTRHTPRHTSKLPYGCSMANFN